MSKQILAAIQGHLGSGVANRVIYVEGPSDVEILFSLLGITPTTTGHYVHKGTLVKDLNGRKKVEEYVNFAATSIFAGRVYGITDGDGDSLTSLRMVFDAPFAGPLFRWKAYNIESLFPQCLWNTAAWGLVPNWQAELAIYSAYVALFQTHQNLEAIQEELHLEQGRRPSNPLRTVAGEKSRLAADKHKIMGFDAESIFDSHVANFHTALNNSVEEAMIYVDGKWLFSHFMVQRMASGGLDHWRNQWITHMTASGGLPDVRNLWQRITGSPP